MKLYCKFKLYGMVWTINHTFTTAHKFHCFDFETQMVQPNFNSELILNKDANKYSNIRIVSLIFEYSFLLTKYAYRA